VWTPRHPHPQFLILPLPSMEATSRRAGQAPATAPPSPAHILPPADRPAPPPSILRFLPHFLTCSPSKLAARLGPPPVVSSHTSVLVPGPTSPDKVSTLRTRRHRAGSRRGSPVDLVPSSGRPVATRGGVCTHAAEHVRTVRRQRWCSSVDAGGGGAP
jgi:hypothetical protein